MKITVGYTRKVAVKQWENEDSHLELTIDVPEHRVNDYQRLIADAQDIVRYHVLNRIPVRFLTDDELKFLEANNGETRLNLADPDDLPF